MVLHLTADLSASSFEPSLSLSTFTFPITIQNLKWPKVVDTDPKNLYILLLEHDNTAPLTISNTDPLVQQSIDITPSHCIPYTLIDPAVLNPLIAASKIGSVTYSVQSIHSFPKFLQADAQPIKNLIFLSNSDFWNDPNVILTFRFTLPIGAPNRHIVRVTLPSLYNSHQLLTHDFVLNLKYQNTDFEIRKDSPFLFQPNFDWRVSVGSQSDLFFDNPNSSTSTGLSSNIFKNCFFKVTKNQIEIYELPEIASNEQILLTLKGLVNPILEKYSQDQMAEARVSGYGQMDKQFDSKSFKEAYPDCNLLYYVVCLIYL